MSIEEFRSRLHADESRDPLFGALRVLSSIELTVYREIRGDESESSGAWNPWN